MTEPADPLVPAPVPVVALQYEQPDARDSRAVRGIWWLAAALLLIAAQPVIGALLVHFGLPGLGRLYYYASLASWLTARAVALTACWIILPGRRSSAAAAGAAVRWGMAVALVVQISPFALQEAHVVRTLSLTRWWGWAAVALQAISYVGMVWALLATHRSLSRVGIPSQVRAFLVVLCIALFILWEGLGVYWTLRFARQGVYNRDAAGLLQAEQVLTWCTSAAAVALSVTLLVARRRLRRASGR